MLVRSQGLRGNNKHIPSYSTRPSASTSQHGCRPLIPSLHRGHISRPRAGWSTVDVPLQPWCAPWLPFAAQRISASRSPSPRRTSPHQVVAPSGHELWLSVDDISTQKLIAYFDSSTRITDRDTDALFLPARQRNAAGAHISVICEILANHDMHSLFERKKKREKKIKSISAEVKRLIHTALR